MHGVPSRIRGVYAITPDESSLATLVQQVGEALAGGVRLLQYRNKLASKSLAREQAGALRTITELAGALLIINDDIDLALEVSADGVHLGRNDCHEAGVPVDLGSIRRHAAQAARRDKPFLVGLSCYNELQAARKAVADGADYIAFGSFFPSITKPLAVTAEWSLIQQAKREFSLPVVAIGGITAQNAPQLIAAGADAIAVISSLFGAKDIRLRAQQLTSFFPENV